MTRDMNPHIALLRTLSAEERNYASVRDGMAAIRSMLNAARELAGCTASVAALVPQVGAVRILALAASAWNAATIAFFDELALDVGTIEQSDGLIGRALRDKRVLVGAPGSQVASERWPTHMCGLAHPIDPSHRLVVGFGGTEDATLLASSFLDDVALALADAVVSQIESPAPDDEDQVQVAEAIVDAMHDAVIRIAPFGEILWVNPATERIFGYDPADLVGQSVRKLVEEGSVSGTEIGQHPDLHTGQQRMLGYHGGLRGRRSDGSRFPMEVTVSRGRLEDKPLLAWIARDISELRRTQRQLDSFFSASHDLLSVMSADGRWIRVNPAWANAVGRPSRELEGRLLVDFVHPEDRAATETGFARLRSGTDSLSLQHRVLDQDGEVRWLECSLSIDHGEDLVYGAARDVTKRRQTEDERRRLVRLKDEFVSNVSHELRTPLTSIRGSLGLLVGGAMGELPPDVHALLRIGLDNTERLVRLVNDLLDLQKMESGRMNYTMVPLDLHSVLSNVLASLAPSASDKEVTLDSSVGLGLHVLGDADRLAQVFTNLVGNAIKFSPQAATVSVRSERMGTRVRISVRDQGAGIAPADHDRVFGRFEQVGADQVNRAGTGLGLAIARTLVEAHGGELGLHSELGAGSEFFVDLEYHEPK